MHLSQQEGRQGKDKEGLYRFHDYGKIVDKSPMMLLYQADPPAKEMD